MAQSVMIQILTQIDSVEQLEQLPPDSVSEVILAHKRLSRLGKLETERLLELAEQAHKKGLRVYLQWDLLATENDFRRILQEVLEQIPLSSFDAIRVQDVGALEWLRQHPAKPKIHWIAETGHHNLPSLQRWVAYVGSALERIVLSIELPLPILSEYCRELSVSCELLAVGRILLFYSPRKLLSPVLGAPTEMTLATVTSTDQHHHEFPVLEHQHGTLMFHHRDLFLLDRIEDLRTSGLHYLRFDIQHMELRIWLPQLQQVVRDGLDSDGKQIRSSWPRQTTQGFFRANRTERPIEKLKNPNLRYLDGEVVGYVLEVASREYMVVASRRSFARGDEMILITPEGKRIPFVVEDLRNWEQQEVETAEVGGLWLLPHERSATAQSLLYFAEFFSDGD